MEKSSSLLVVSLVCICIVFTLLIYPIKAEEQGTIQDWIGNDNGFGIIVNDKVYWLSYSNINSNLTMPNFPHHYCKLEYNTNIFGWRGSPNSYRETLNLTVYD